MVTIKDVALQAGVSIATVSRVMNNVDNVGEEYKTAVQKAIEELNYQPNAVARSMKKRTFRTIGVIMSDFSVPFFEKIIKQIEKTFRSKGHLVLFVNTYDNPATEKQGIQFMVEKQADVILICSTGENEDYLAQLQEQGISVIFFDRRSKDHLFPTYYVDKRKAIYHALEYLYQMEQRKIAFISGPRQLSTNYDRYMGIMDFVYEKEINPNSISYYFGSFSEEYGYSVMDELLREKEPPSAVIVGSAVLAAGVLLYCKEHDIVIPGQLSLISFGDFSSGKLIEPRLTYLEDMHDLLGQLLVEAIQESFDQTLEPRQITIPSELINNASVSQPARQSP